MTGEVNGAANPARRAALVALAAWRTGVAVLAAGAGTAAKGADDAQVPGAQKRPWPATRRVPALRLPALDGPPFDLATGRGQVLVLNFWASWCEPCRAEMPALELLEQRYQAQGVRVLAINFRETESAVRRYVAQSALGLKVLRDADGAAARTWGVRIFPSTIVVSRSGRPAFTVTGEVDWTGDTARAWMDAVL